MQSFLPYSDFYKSAQSLDKKRCWKQVVETKQILCALNTNNLPTDWQTCKTYINKTGLNHPAVQMWKGHEEYLKVYYNIFLDYCKNTLNINTSLERLSVDYSIVDNNVPWWMDNDQFHRSHRARLIEKDREFYLPKFPEDEKYNEGRYWWPDMKTKTFKII